jgi:hypothetical protein
MGWGRYQVPDDAQRLAHVSRASRCMRAIDIREMGDGRSPGRAGDSSRLLHIGASRSGRIRQLPGQRGVAVATSPRRRHRATGGRHRCRRRRLRTRPLVPDGPGLSALAREPIGCDHCSRRHHRVSSRARHGGSGASLSADGSIAAASRPAEAWGRWQPIRLAHGHVSRKRELVTSKPVPSASILVSSAVAPQGMRRPCGTGRPGVFAPSSSP